MTEEQMIDRSAYLTFSDQIHQDSVRRFFASLNLATQSGIQSVHVLFNSNGGSVSDGIALHNFLKSFPCHVSLYNSGAVQSIAAVAFLGAKRRVVSETAIFMIHRTTCNTPGANASMMRAMAEATVLNDRITERILRSNLSISDDKWALLDHRDIHFSADEAVKAKIATDIGDFTPPFGSQVFNI